MQPPQGPLKPRNFRLQLFSYAGNEIVGVNMAAVLHSVSESDVFQFDVALFHQQQDVVNHRGECKQLRKCRRGCCYRHLAACWT